MCANIDFPFPGTLVSTALARATGNDPKADPWLPERAVWPLMEVVEEHFDEPWLAPLADHIRNSGVTGDEAEPGTPEEPNRFSIVRHVADLFDRYAVHRPDMLQRWAAGSAQLDEAVWQFELWRLLRERIGRPSPAEHLQTACRKLREERDLLDLPRRLSLFGLTRLPASYLDALDAVASKRDVHLFLLHPSPELWRRLEEQVGPGTRHLPRREDVTASAPRNPLLASWGRDAREMQLVLGGTRDPRRRGHGGGARGCAHPAAADPGRRQGRPLAGGRERRRRSSPVGDRRRQHPRALLPRPGPPGRGPARRHPSPAGGGSGARASRHHRDVPRHRALRPTHPGNVRRA